MKRDSAARPVGELGLSVRDRRACGASGGGGGWSATRSCSCAWRRPSVGVPPLPVHPVERGAGGRLAADSAPSGQNCAHSGRHVQGAARAPPDPAI